MKKERVVFIAAAAGLYAALCITGLGCPIKFMTGISCAGCGMTRACLALARLDIRDAVHFHPLVFVPPVYAAAFFAHKKTGKGVRFIKCANALGIALFLAVYIARLLNPLDTVVVFDIQNGLFFKLLKYAGGIFNG